LGFVTNVDLTQHHLKSLATFPLRWLAFVQSSNVCVNDRVCFNTKWIIEWQWFTEWQQY